MSDEHKTDDAHDTHAAHDSHESHDHGHHDAAHHDDAPAATPAHDDHPAADAAGDHGHAPVEAAAHGHDSHDAHHDDGHGHADHGHEAPAAHDHAHDDHAHDDHGTHHDAGHEAPAAHDDHGHDDHGAHHDAGHDHATHGHEAAGDHAHDAPAGDTHGHTPAAAVDAGHVAAAAPVKPPVWSDHGDAPFEDAAPAPVKTAKKARKKASGGGNEFVEIIKTIVFALLIALVLRVFLFQPFTIPSASMEPNLYEGDYIVVTKWSYGYSRHSIPGSPGLFNGRILERSPQRGDIAVFKLPTDNKTDYIKRVIGLPGDRIQMINNRLYLNGTIVPDVMIGQTEEADAYGPRPVTRLSETLPGGKDFTINDYGPGFPLDNTQVFTVPAGHYFMMGDNRDNSIDSREYPERGGVGLVPAENLEGKAQIILFSWSPGASLFNPVSWFTKLRPSRFFTVLD